MRERGFTTIELLLSLTIIGVFIASLSVFLQLVLESRARHEVALEVESIGAQVMQTITQAARNAESITAPSSGATATSLTLDVVSAAVDPTVFDLSGGVIRVTEGAGSAVNLTSSELTASSFNFQNLTPTSGSPGVLRVSFTLTAINTSTRQEFTYSETFYATASLRQP